ncbi:MAG: HTH domain-containing protein [Opitutia bacterium]
MIQPVPVPTPRYTVRLTRTEQRLVWLVAEKSLTLAALARHLNCSRSTVKNHVNRIATKIPGDLPAFLRITLWARGTPVELLYLPPPLQLAEQSILDRNGVITRIVLEP